MHKKTGKKMAYGKTRRGGTPKKSSGVKAKMKKNPKGMKY